MVRPLKSEVVRCSLLKKHSKDDGSMASLSLSYSTLDSRLPGVPGNFLCSFAADAFVVGRRSSAYVCTGTVTVDDIFGGATLINIQGKLLFNGIRHFAAPQ
jgi:hypothetical protein